MRKYVVKQGDTLFGIARRELGAPGEWRLIMQLNGLPSGAIRVGQVLRLPGGLEESPDVVAPPNVVEPPAPVRERVRILKQGGSWFAEDGSGRGMRIGREYKRGIYRLGRVKPEDFLASAGSRLASLQLTESEIKVMIATAENEGNLDAVNSWDGHFMSFGMFQWTAGGNGNKGELPALLGRIRLTFPDDFEHYWGRYGLGVEGVGQITGWLTLNGRRLNSGARKKALRSPLWAYRFARAGANEEVNSIQVAHAVARIGQFYFRPFHSLDGHRLAELITSEYGVALLLDNHVNRPAYVVPCVAKALERVGMSPGELVNGSDDDERLVVESYLKVRRSYGKKPMTNAAHRGIVTGSYLSNGTISDQRGSFCTNQG